VCAGGGIAIVPRIHRDVRGSLTALETRLSSIFFPSSFLGDIDRTIYGADAAYYLSI